MDPNDESKLPGNVHEDLDVVPEGALLDGAGEMDEEAKQPNPPGYPRVVGETVDNIVAGHPEKTNATMGNMDNDAYIHPSTDPTEDSNQVRILR